MRVLSRDRSLGRGGRLAGLADRFEVRVSACLLEPPRPFELGREEPFEPVGGGRLAGLADRFEVWVSACLLEPPRPFELGWEGPSLVREGPSLVREGPSLVRLPPRSRSRLLVWVELVRVVDPAVGASASGLARSSARLAFACCSRSRWRWACTCSSRWR